MKHCLLTILAVLLALTAAAKSNRVYMDDFEIDPDSTLVVPIYLVNESRTYGLQLNLTPPEGLAVLSIDMTSRLSAMSMNLSEAEGTYTVVIYNMNLTPIRPDSAAVLNITFQAAPDFTGGDVLLWQVYGSTYESQSFDIDGDTARVTVPTSWLNGVPGDQPAVREQYFNLLGQPIASPDSVPVAIQVSTRADGERSSRKIASRH